MEELKDCPKCDWGRPSIGKIYIKKPNEARYRVICPKCKLTTLLSYDNEEEAIDAWNKEQGEKQ